jgi:hypothetical protein
MSGRDSRRRTAIRRERDPPQSPLMVMMTRGSFAAMLRAKLLSRDQKRLAARIPSAESENPNKAEGFRERRMQAEVISRSAVQTLCPTSSRKRSTARTVVVTASKSRRREAVAAWVDPRLTIKVTGARKPPKKMTPSSQGRS